MTRLVAGALVLALSCVTAAAAPARKAPAHRPAAVRDWSRTVTLSASGGFVLGNPKAAVQVIEFGSYSCPHCAVFSGTVLPQVVARYVRPGQVSYEFRNSVRDRYDLVASVLARCTGARGFFPATAAVYAAQQDWMDQAIAYEQAHADEIDALQGADKGAAIAKAAGLDSLFAARGLPLDKQHACLADEGRIKTVLDFAREAATRNIPGTPAIYIDGTLFAGAPEWPRIDAALAAALKK